MKYRQLSQEERYTITALLKSKVSLSEIARQMGRSTSTITRELSRNRRPSGACAASVAHSYATARRRAVRRGSQFSAEQWSAVLYLIQLDYSPEQASYIIEQYFGFSISHETIYQYLLYDKKKAAPCTSTYALCLKGVENVIIHVIPGVDCLEKAHVR